MWEIKTNKIELNWIELNRHRGGIRVLLFLSILEQQQQQQILVPLKNKQAKQQTNKQTIKTVKEKIPRQQQQQKEKILDNFGGEIMVCFWQSLFRKISVVS